MIRSRILKHFLKPRLSKSMRFINYYITTPIFYVNAAPHIGHVYTLLLADALNIFNRLKLGNDATILSTGTDEHGVKIQTAAKANNLSSQEFCNVNSQRFVSLFSQYDTTVTDFIRTTEDRHKMTVQTMWSELEDRGFIYKDSYSGWYCISDEVFVPESQVTSKLIHGDTVHHDNNGNTVVWYSEENYMFRLGQLEEEIQLWLSRDKPIVPTKFNDIMLNSMKKSRIGDISISRPKSRLDWGIEVPGDANHTIYVWLDALANYLTVAGYPCEPSSLKRWPVDCHVVGKDIIKFHAAYWPAFLIALSLPLPRRILCHSHWTLESLKMSKSRGNIIDPWQENALLTAEGLRYYLLRTATNHSDSDYSSKQALHRVNAELADTFGNLMSRCSGVAINPGQVIPKSLIAMNNMEQFQELLIGLQELASECQKHYEIGDFYKGVDQIMATLRLNNKIYEEAKPWELIKHIRNNSEAYKVYHNLQAITFETIRICSILLQPIIPKLSNTALSCMNAKGRTWEDANLTLEYGDPGDNIKLDNKSQHVLFRRIK